MLLTGQFNANQNPTTLHGNIETVAPRPHAHSFSATNFQKISSWTLNTDIGKKASQKRLNDFFSLRFRSVGSVAIYSTIFRSDNHMIRFNKQKQTLRVLCVLIALSETANTRITGKRKTHTWDGINFNKNATMQCWFGANALVPRQRYG